MRLTYHGPHAEVEIAETGQKVTRGDSIDVDDGLATRLLDQPDNWKKARVAKKEDG